MRKSADPSRTAGAERETPNTGFVADASVGISWAVAAQSTPETDRLLESVAAGAPLVVPGLWKIEVANALIVLLRRNRIRNEEYAEALRLFAGLRLVVDDEGPELAFSRVSELAAQYRLTVYDAVYLELALRRRLPLASRDAGLNRAAALCRVGVPV